jgi:hypothetical protein
MAQKFDIPETAQWGLGSFLITHSRLYETLSSTRPEIRVIEIQPEEDESIEIHCTMSHIVLSNDNPPPR